MSSLVLPLTIKKQWFNMILEGIKKEEYREIKDYWKSRLMNDDGSFKEFSTIRFTNGYGSDKPSFDIQCNGIRIDTGIPEWGGSNETNVFVLELGDIRARRNC